MQQPQAAGMQVQSEVERAIQRYVKGLEYFSSPAPVLGATPKDLIHARGTLNLYHYRPMADEVYRVPVLIVMATTNRGYILDLAPGQSFVEFLLKSGFDVYMMDWNPPRPEEKGLRIEDYAFGFVGDCIERVMRDCGEREVSLVGYCFGGVLSVMYAAAHTGGPLRNLVCFTTPVDFSKMGLFTRWSDPKFFDVDRLVDTLGNVPPDLIFASFEMLRPATRQASQMRLWDRMWDDEFVRQYRMFDRWATDTLPLAGEYFRQTIHELLRGNRLYSGELTLAGKRVDPRAISVPFLHCVAEHDHIVPSEASQPLIELVASTDKEEIVLKGGHVSVAAGANAVRRLWPKVNTWLATRSV